MTIQSGQNLAGSIGVPYSPEKVEIPVVLDRDPTSRDVVNYPLGKRWLHRADSEWVLYNQTTINGVLESDWRRVSGGTGAFLAVTVPLGTSPVFPNLSGFIGFTSNDGSVQITGSTSSINFGINGGQAATRFGVDATSGTGTNPVVPDIGLVTITGTRVIAGTNPIRTVSTLPNQYQIQLQTAQAIPSTNASNVGVAAFDSNDFTVDANGFVSLSGSVPTTDLHVAKWIVNPAGASAGANQTTIASAMAAATSGETIFVMPANYIENFTWKAGVNIVAFNGDGNTPNVTIIGKITASDAGVRSMSGIRLQTNSDFFLVVSGSANTVVNFRDCFFNCTNNTGISITSSGSGAIVATQGCSGNIGTTGITFCTSSASASIAALDMRTTYIGNTGLSTVASTFSGSGSVLMFDSAIQFPITTSGTAGVLIDGSTILMATNTTALTIGGTPVAPTTNSLTFSDFASGTASAIVVNSPAFLHQIVVNSTNTNAITGSGTISYGGIAYNNGSYGNNVTNKIPQVLESGYYKGLQTGASPLAGTIGEEIRATLASGSATSLVTGTAKNVVSISLTAGIFIVYAQCGFIAEIGTTTTQNAVSISEVSNTLDPDNGDATVINNYMVPLTGFGPTLTIAGYKIIVPTTTTIYMVAQSTFAVSGTTAYGRLNAVRAA